MNRTKSKLEEVFKAQREVVKSLFLDLPSLQSFTTENRWQSHLSVEFVNDIRCPFNSRGEELSEEEKAWLVEIGLTKDEFIFLCETVYMLRHCPTVDTARIHKRQEYLE